jgi:hypothetical protein
LPTISKVPEAPSENPITLPTEETAPQYSQKTGKFAIVLIIPKIC